MKHRFYMTAELQSVEETTSLRKEVSSVIDLPEKAERQPDLAYFTSRFVSTGTNLNNAHFLASELVQASETIPAKAVDVEHEEDKIIGHIYSHEFTDETGAVIDKAALLQNQEYAALDGESMHIEIASVIYKTRFPEIAEEIHNGEWKVSMEAYFTDYDVLVGSTILSKDEAMLMGLDVVNEELYGQSAKIVKGGETVDEGKVARVLRGICFSGVGIVKNPANPPSIVFEATASKDVTEIVLNMDDITGNNVTSSNIDKTKENSDLQYNDTVGICVSYHKELNDTIVKDQDSEVIRQQWCSKFDANCPTYGESTSPDCLRFTIGDMVYVSASEIYDNSQFTAFVSDVIGEIQESEKINRLVENIEKLLD